MLILFFRFCQVYFVCTGDTFGDSGTVYCKGIHKTHTQTNATPLSVNALLSTKAERRSERFHNCSRVELEKCCHKFLIKVSKLFSCYYLV